MFMIMAENAEAWSFLTSQQQNVRKSIFQRAFSSRRNIHIKYTHAEKSC